MRIIATLFGILLLVSSTIASANCDFKQGDFIPELQDPSFIELIEINIPKSAKYAKNSMRVITSKSKNIPPKLKKTFAANIVVHYQFGKCVFKGKVRQHGDWKDHIKLADGGKLIRSIDVKMRSGNILSSVHFKLLIPSTRNSENEILASLLLKRLNFISPDTFAVKTKINDVYSVMLFQENARKELLEKNKRRESALFEGDEKLLWSYKNFETFELAALSLARMTNRNWFLKGNSSAKISLSSFSLLQASHLERSGYLIDPNKQHDSTFADFAFILLAMNGHHGLAIHNRKYFFNAVASKFEPVYYDGNVSFVELGTGVDGEYTIQTIQNFESSIGQKFIEKILSEIVSHELKTDFIKRSKNLDFDQNLFLQSSLSQLKINVKTLRKMIAGKQKTTKIPSSQKLDDFLKKNQKSGFSQLIIKKISMGSQSYDVTFQDGSKTNLTSKEISNLISNNEIYGERAIFLGNFTFTEKSEHKIYKDLLFGGEVITSSGISFSVDNRAKTIIFQQSKPEDWVVIKLAKLDGWKLKMNGKKSNYHRQTTLDERFNEFGVTGCLTVLDSKLSNAFIHVTGGFCEDSVNIISSVGSIKAIKIQDAFADAIDLDFSSLTIDQVKVENAANDCVDVSGGNYTIKTSDLQNCADKGISIGEASKFLASTVSINSTTTGISAKDLSEAVVNTAEIHKSTNCLEVTQKKQEFGGANLGIGKLNCIGKILIDQNSTYRTINR